MSFSPRATRTAAARACSWSSKRVAEAQAALREGAELAAAGAELSVVTLAPQAKPFKCCGGGGPGPYNCAVRDQAQEELRQAQSLLGSLARRATFTVLAGIPRPAAHRVVGSARLRRHLSTGTSVCPGWWSPSTCAASSLLGRDTSREVVPGCGASCGRICVRPGPGSSRQVATLAAVEGVPVGRGKAIAFAAGGLAVAVAGMFMALALADTSRAAARVLVARPRPPRGGTFRPAPRPRWGNPTKSRTRGGAARSTPRSCPPTARRTCGGSTTAPRVRSPPTSSAPRPGSYVGAHAAATSGPLVGQGGTGAAFDGADLRGDRARCGRRAPEPTPTRSSCGRARNGLTARTAS